MTTQRDVSTLPSQSGESFEAPPTPSHVATTPKDESNAGAGSAKEAGREVMSEVSDQVSAVTETAKDQIQTLVGRARDEFSGQSEARGEQMISAVQSFAQQLGALANGEPDRAGELGTVVRDAQRRVQSYASSLQARGPRALADDVSSFARRRPATFLAAAGIAGFAIGRLVRSGAMQGGQTSELSASRSTGTPLPPPEEFDLSDSFTASAGTTTPTSGAMPDRTVGVTTS